jgi:hypothetical protein
MGTALDARPDLGAHRESISKRFPEIVKELTGILGRKLIAYIGRAKDVRTVDGWAAGVEPYRDAEARVRLAFHVARMLQQHEAREVIQAWFTGVNPELNDRVPVRLLREGELEAVAKAVLTAARAFLAGG